MQFLGRWIVSAGRTKNSVSFLFPSPNPAHQAQGDLFYLSIDEGIKGRVMTPACCLLKSFPHLWLLIFLPHSRREAGGGIRRG
jgi:hypothetical protein